MLTTVLFCISEALCSSCDVPEWLFKIMFWLGYCNSLMNPVIYSCASKDFQIAFARLLRCRCRTRRPVTPTAAGPRRFVYEEDPISLRRPKQQQQDANRRAVDRLGGGCPVARWSHRQQQQQRVGGGGGVRTCGNAASSVGGRVTRFECLSRWTDEDVGTERPAIWNITRSNLRPDTKL